MGVNLITRHTFRPTLYNMLDGRPTVVKVYCSRLEVEASLADRVDSQRRQSARTERGMTASRRTILITPARGKGIIPSNVVVTNLESNL